MHDLRGQPEDALAEAEGYPVGKINVYSSGGAVQTIAIVNRHRRHELGHGFRHGRDAPRLQRLPDRLGHPARVAL